MKGITQRISALNRVLLGAALGLALLPRLPAASRAAPAPLALLEETPAPGRLGMSRALSLSNTTPRVGEVVTATFAVQNVAGQALMLEQIDASAHLDRSWGGPAYDFPLDVRGNAQWAPTGVLTHMPVPASAFADPPRHLWEATRLKACDPEGGPS